MSDMQAKLDALASKYEQARLAEATARARLDQAKETEAEMLSQLQALGFSTLEDAQKFVTQATGLLEQEISSLTELLQ